MPDISLVHDAGTREFDFAIAANGDLASEDSLAPAILLSLLTDQRASADEAPLPQHRRGWIGDLAADNGFQLGSKLWLIEPSRLTPQTANQAAAAAQAALEWMVRDGIAQAVEVLPVLDPPYRLGLAITLTAPIGGAENHYIPLWERTVFTPSILTPRVDIEPPTQITPETVPDLVALVDPLGALVAVDPDGSLGLIRDKTEAYNFANGDSTKRPRWIIGGPGSVPFIRFEPGQFLITQESLFPSFREGSVLVIQKPRDAATDGGHLLALAVAGNDDSVFGLSIRQRPDDELQLIGQLDTLDVTVPGPDGEFLYGTLFRWGPAEDGADGETTAGGNGSDDSYAPDLPNPARLVIGAGFDGVGADEDDTGAFDLRLLAVYNRRIADLEVFNLLEHSATLLFRPPEGETFSDFTMFDDGTGFEP